MTRSIDGPLTFTRCAIINDQQIVVAASPDEDDAGFPFTRICHYNNGNWNFTDLEFAVAGISSARRGSNVNEEIVVLGENGEFINLYRPNDVAIISDASVPADARLGLFTSITAIKSRFYVCGDGGQFYIEQPNGTWKAVLILLDMKTASPEDDILTLLRNPHMLNDPAFMKEHTTKVDNNVSKTIWKCSGCQENKIYLCGGKGNIKRFIFFWDGDQLSDVSDGRPYADEYTMALTDILVDPENGVWIVGHQGALITGDNINGFSQDPSAEINDLFYSIASFKSKIYIAGRSGLYRHDGERLTRIRPGIALRGSPFHSLRSGDGVLWAVGAKDIAQFDGVDWRRIEWA